MKHRHEVQVVKRTLNICSLLKVLERKREKKESKAEEEDGKEEKGNEREKPKHWRERGKMVSRILINYTSGVYRGSPVGL